MTGEAAAVNSTSVEANLEVAFGGTAPTGDEANYQVLDTDYENYAIVHSGSSTLFGLACVEFVCVLSRTPELSDDDILKVRNTIRKKLPKYDYEGLAVFNRQGENCPYDDQPE